QVPVEPVVGVLAYGAGVEHHQIGLLLSGARYVARLFQQPGDALGVVHVHLATERAHLVRPRVHPARLAPRRAARPGEVAARTPRGSRRGHPGRTPRASQPSEGVRPAAPPPDEGVRRPEASPPGVPSRASAARWVPGGSGPRATPARGTPPGGS